MSLLDTNPVIPTLILFAASLFMASLFVHKISFFRSVIDREVASRRFHAIDGLRGFLAIAVIVHHIGINHSYYLSGLWDLTPSRLNTFLGRSAVAMFFMITSFLFWGRAIASNGEIDARQFYISRIRRVVPMYFLASGLLVITALALTHFRITVGAKELLQQILAWLLFTIPGAPSINGLDKTYLINTVFWSLAFEWKFYLLLPLIAIFARRYVQWIFAVVSSMLIYAFSQTGLEWFFLFGCVTAVLVRVEWVSRVARHELASLLAIACLGAVLLWQPLVYSFAGASLLLVPFLIFASGNSVFGILTCRPARMLGLISYSIYLMHNWVLYLASRAINHFTPVANLTPIEYWLVGLMVVLATLFLSLLTYRFVEYPLLVGPRSQAKLDVKIAAN